MVNVRGTTTADERRHKGTLECLSDSCDCFAEDKDKVLDGERPPWVATGGNGESYPEWLKTEEYKQRRERIATAVLANIGTLMSRAINAFEVNARYAVEQADALIAELDK